jgi:hypothetical protein
MEDGMRVMLLLPLAAVLSLAACGGGEERTAATDGAAASGATGGSANAASATMPRLRPGNYEVRVNITRFEVPGLPPEIAAQMQQSMAGVGQQVQNQCVTAEQSAQSMENIYKGLGQGNCTTERMSITGGQISGAMRCDSGGGRTMAMTIEGAMNDDGSTTNMSMIANDPSLPSGQIETDMSVTMVRTGDCAAGAAAR